MRVQELANRVVHGIPIVKVAFIAIDWVFQTKCPRKGEGKEYSRALGIPATSGATARLKFRSPMDYNCQKKQRELKVGKGESGKRESGVSSGRGIVSPWPIRGIPLQTVFHCFVCFLFSCWYSLSPFNVILPLVSYACQSHHQCWSISAEVTCNM